jgi:tannase/feruloyl esterase
MRRSSHLLTALTAILVTASAHRPVRAQTPQGFDPSLACSEIKTLRLPDVRLTDVAEAADSLPHADSVRTPHCRVSGIIGREIKFTAMLPYRWNQRLLMGGNGGFAGSVETAVFQQTRNGYVTVSTNTGHEASGITARWALDQPERQVNYGSVAVHRTVEVAKALARAFYGSDPRYSYFFGCSNGGRQGLIEVQRYPKDFDGVVAGAPAAHLSLMAGVFLKNVREDFPTPTYYAHPVVTRENLDLLAGKILDACDAIDGVRDGILTDPRDCKFQLASIRACPAGRPGSDCLTAAQRSAIARIYAPATDDKGRVVYPGQPFGGENLPGGWSTWIVGNDSGFLRSAHQPSLAMAFMTEGARYLVFGDSTWSYSSYHGTLFPESRRMAPLGDATDTDLRPFAAHKGKLIIYHGWADPALNPLATIDYYQKVVARDSAARESVSLFLLPGVLHCAGGSGPSDVDWMAAITDWTERATAPQRLVASSRDRAGRTTRTRPICAYPKRPTYTGTGSTDDASSFACREP